MSLFLDKAFTYKSTQLHLTACRGCVSRSWALLVAGPRFPCHLLFYSNSNVLKSCESHAIMVLSYQLECDYQVEFGNLSIAQQDRSLRHTKHPRALVQIRRRSSQGPRALRDSTRNSSAPDPGHLPCIPDANLRSHNLVCNEKRGE